MKTGSIRCKIDDTNKSYYTILINAYDAWFDNDKKEAAVNVPKSAVTDIREEVDWSKVEKGAPIVLRGSSRIEFYAGHNIWGVYLCTTYDETVQRKDHEACTVVDKSGVLPYADWLKEHGGQDG